MIGEHRMLEVLSLITVNLAKDAEISKIGFEEIMAGGASLVLEPPQKAQQ